MNKAAANIGVQACEHTSPFLLGNFLGVALLSHREPCVELYRKLPNFTFKANHCTIPNFNQQGMRIPVAPYSHQDLTLSFVVGGVVFQV